MIETLTVDLGERTYPIHIGSNLANNLDELLNHIKIADRKIHIITDANVSKTHAPRYFDALQKCGASKILQYTIPAGEGSKSFQQLESLCADLLTNGLKRSDLIITLGGGVIGDLGGFVASIIMRGVDFVQIPTTILAQVDSSVGGKTGINTAQGKNLVGAFYQPRAVIIDIESLKTLPEREIKAGYGEIVKYGLINNLEFFKWLEKNGEKLYAGDADALMHAIRISCQSKADIVAKDERESGCRALLNLGHTFGHALEAVCGYNGTLLHGEAVAIGMVQAFDVSVALGLCPEQDAIRIRTHLEKMGLPTTAADINGLSPDVTAEQLYTLMQGDKKATDTTINFIMAKGIGQSYITSDVDEQTILNVLSKSLKGK